MGLYVSLRCISTECTFAIASYFVFDIKTLKISLFSHHYTHFSYTFYLLNETPPNSMNLKVRQDDNPMLKQGVVGAFILVRVLSKIQVPTYCTAAPLSCELDWIKMRKNIL